MSDNEKVVIPAPLQPTFRAIEHIPLSQIPDYAERYVANPSVNPFTNGRLGSSHGIIHEFLDALAEKYLKRPPMQRHSRQEAAYWSGVSRLPLSYSQPTQPPPPPPSPKTPSPSKVAIPPPTPPSPAKVVTPPPSPPSPQPQEPKSSKPEEDDRYVRFAVRVCKLLGSKFDLKKGKKVVESYAKHRTNKQKVQMTKLMKEMVNRPEDVVAMEINEDFRTDSSVGTVYYIEDDEFKLGEGSYGVVYLGSFKGANRKGIPVAVKIAKEDESFEYDELLQEIDLIHKNSGSYYVGSSSRAIVTKVLCGSLLHFLSFFMALEEITRDKQSRNDWLNGVAYLMVCVIASFSPYYYARSSANDIKPDNILFDFFPKQPLSVKAVVLDWSPAFAGHYCSADQTVYGNACYGGLNQRGDIVSIHTDLESMFFVFLDMFTAGAYGMMCDSLHLVWGDIEDTEELKAKAMSQNDKVDSQKALFFNVAKDAMISFKLPDRILDAMVNAENSSLTPELANRYREACRPQSLIRGVLQGMMAAVKDIWPGPLCYDENSEALIHFQSSRSYLK